MFATFARVAECLLLFIGCYLLATMQRLPVVDEMGRAVSDRVVVGRFETRGP